MRRLIIQSVKNNHYALFLVNSTISQLVLFLKYITVAIRILDCHHGSRIKSGGTVINFCFLNNLLANITFLRRKLWWFIKLMWVKLFLVHGTFQVSLLSPERQILTSSYWTIIPFLNTYVALYSKLAWLNINN